MHFKRWIYFFFLLKISMVLVFSDENPNRSTDAGVYSTPSSNDSEFNELLKEVRKNAFEYFSARLEAFNIPDRIPDDAIPDFDSDDDFGLPPDTKYLKLFKYMQSREDPQVERDGIYRLMAFRKKVDALNARLKDAHVSNSTRSEILLEKEELLTNFQNNEIEEFRNSLKTITAPPFKFDFKLPESKFQDTDSGRRKEDAEVSTHPLPIYMYFIIIPLGVVIAILRYLCISYTRRKCREFCMNGSNSGDMNQLV